MKDDMTISNFDSALKSFVAGCQRILDAWLQKQPTGRRKETLTIDPRGRRYVRIVVCANCSAPGTLPVARSHVIPGARSAHCFVDRTNGDVLKAASWKAPAKHARGNIFDAHNGLASMGPHGPAYLR